MDRARKNNRKYRNTETPDNICLCHNYTFMYMGYM